MRPVNKKNPGDVIEYSDSQGRTVKHTVQAEYAKYCDAKQPLAASLGKYCAYCERAIPSIANIEVEHLEPKGDGGSETSWDNFLISCKCCNTVKPKTGIKLADSHWPHLDNTFIDFIYDAGGRVLVNPNLAGEAKKKAERLYELFKLGRYPHTGFFPTDADDRWKGRMEAWTLAETYKTRYQNGLLLLDDIVEMARAKGFWSVWYTVFDGIDEVRQALITAFPGTSAECFDKKNHFMPISR